MNEDLKIYTAAEVQSVGYSKEQIEQSAAKLTQEAYEAAKSGADEVTYYHANLKLLNGIAHRLRDLGYTTEVSESAFGDNCIFVHWYIN